MIKKERQEQILELIRIKHHCTVPYLARELYVSPVTIRRDLAEMEEKGLIQRSWGGAAFPEHENREVPFEVRSKRFSSVKEALAKRAAEEIRKGDVIFMDASSTVSHMVNFLRPDYNLTVITNSLYVAEKLKEKHIACYVTGGLALENSKALVGNLAEKALEELYANVCFFSSQGMDENGVISDQSKAETALRKRMLQNSGRQFFLFDQSKYKKRFAFRLCQKDELTGIITDLTE